MTRHRRSRCIEYRESRPAIRCGLDPETAELLPALNTGFPAIETMTRAQTRGGGPGAVVSVDYRPAPESWWPAAAEDLYAALCWAAGHAEAIGCDAGRLVVAGDSAGGNLAASPSNADNQLARQPPKSTDVVVTV